jgi:hypothetical protein
MLKLVKRGAKPMVDPREQHKQIDPEQPNRELSEEKSPSPRYSKEDETHRRPEQREKPYPGEPTKTPGKAEG